MTPVKRFRPRRSRPAPCLVLLSCLVLLGCPSAPPEPTGPAPRIFVVTIDTLRADHLGLYGYPRPTSPFLDALGAKSVVLDNAFATCSHTGPSHASLFTGLQPAQHRLLENGQALPDSVRTLAQAFSDAGYRTAGFSTVSFILGLAAGFQDMYHRSGFYTADVLFGEALDYLRDLPADQPAFVWIHLFDVHEWAVPEHIYQETLAEIREAGPTGDDLFTFLVEEHSLIEERIPRAKILESVDAYDGQILATDRAFESFFNTVNAEGLAEGGVWLITSDHGEGLGNHDHLGHGKTIYNEQTRVPFIFYRRDGAYPPRRAAELVSLVDVAPTLAEMAGIPFDEQPVPMEGRSFLSVLDGSGDPPWEAEPVYSQRRPADELRLKQGWIPGDVFALQTEDLKVIVSTEGEYEVYDLANDPYEVYNLIDNPPEGKEALLRELVRLYRRMTEESEGLSTEGINPEYIEELKALGYL